MQKNVKELLAGNRYPGRGILLGCGADANTAVLAYFIMGRSDNSRNRTFVRDGDELRIRFADPAKVKDASLIFYAPLRLAGKSIVVTNGDQTDTIIEALAQHSTFEAALRTRRFEPDAPNLTPRISGIILPEAERFAYRLSILKAGDAAGETCSRQTFEYEPIPGMGHVIHTYQGDGNPLPSFQGEPRPVALPGSAAELAASLWDALDADNRISLYVRYTNLRTGAYEDQLLNKYESEAK